MICKVCNHESENKNWIRLEVNSSDGYSRISGSRWNEEEKKWDYYGSVPLYACPECGTIRIWL